MSTFRMTLAGAVIAAGLLIPAGIAQAAPAIAKAPAPAATALPGNVRLVPAARPGVSYNGCPAADVCMYTTSGWTSGHPEHKYYAYACYTLSNELGTRVIYNVQTGGAQVGGYYNSNCTSKAWQFGPDINNGEKVDITPINSIKLFA